MMSEDCTDSTDDDEQWDENAFQAERVAFRENWKRKLNAERWLERFGTPDCVGSYHLYAYEYIDELGFMPSAREAFGDWEHADALIQAVEARLKKIGWEGDGVMQVMWLPPFLGIGPHDTDGCFVLHVKQDNDGISWLACPYQIPFIRRSHQGCALIQPPCRGTSPPGLRYAQHELRKLTEQWAEYMQPDENPDE